ncbi:Sporulation related domain protein [Pseudoruegeria aquimaris]|uniref:Sporulation related domain protein n=1 Tax=Pseudoruegeria aquimaris TaxID=393663 RepID=A0A1Y5RBD8_9RHOB|nr:SPOR domain-containing protein [Pseudoruegeria aquimaris]SLN12709.1 Sporulation related domain protein [Pseudoruegeria aquimaris]
MAQFETGFDTGLNTGFNTGATAGEHPAQDGGVLPAEQVSKAVKWVGASLSLALMVGLGFWGYRLALRDVTGVPVVRALEGPMRVAPDDPGGKLAEHIGLAVNAVQARGEAEDLPEQVALAPVVVDVIDADTPGLAPRPEGTARGEKTPVAAAPATADINAQPAALSVSPEAGAPAAPARAADGTSAAILALADQIAAGAKPLAQVAPGATPPAAAAVEDAAEAVEIAAVSPDVIPASIPGVARSLLPRPRPAGLKATPQGPLDLEEGSADGAVEVPVEQIAPGTSLVQLGAFESLDTARNEWSRLAAELSDYLDPKSRVIEKATRAGRTFYRLRAAGFEDINDARRFCSALQAEGAECIPVIYR